METVTQQNIKWTHTKAVFRAIAQSNSENTPIPVSRAAVAERTTLSLMTVGKIVDQLVASDILVQYKESHSAAGRRTRLVSCNPNWYSLVLDLTSRDFRMIVLDLNLHVTAEMRYPYDDTMYCEENLLLFLKNLPVWMNVPYTSTHCIGIGVLVPGTYDEEHDRIFNTRLPELAPIQPRALISAYFTQTPIFFLEDLRAAAISAMDEAPKIQTTRILLSLGRPVSGLVLTESGPLFGKNGLAGRFGEIIVESGLTLDDALITRKDRRELAEAIGTALKSLIAIFDPEEIILESSRFPLDESFIGILNDYISAPSSLLPQPILSMSNNLLGHACHGLALELRETWLYRVTSGTSIE